MSYTESVISEKILSRNEYDGNPFDFPTGSKDHKIIEDICEIVLIRTDNLSGKKEKITRKVKRIKRIYGMHKGVLERRKWGKFGSELDNEIRPIKGDEIFFNFTKQPETAPKLFEKIQEQEAFIPKEFVPEDKPFTPEVKNDNKPEEEAIFVPDFAKIEEATKKYSVFIRDIPAFIDRYDIIDFIREEAEKFGEVKFVKVPEIRNPEQKSCIAFVDFCKKNDAENFISAKILFEGVVLAKDWSRDK